MSRVARRGRYSHIAVSADFVGCKPTGCRIVSGTARARYFVVTVADVAYTQRRHECMPASSISSVAHVNLGIFEK